jgi:hypothetical protein
MFLWQGYTYYGVENILGQINTNIDIDMFAYCTWVDTWWQ